MSVKDLQAVVAEPVSPERSCKAPYQETEEMAGSKGMITKWPKAAKTVINCLLAEEREEVEAMAEKWNNEAAPPDIQAEVAKSKGADMIEHFATEMFKKARMRVCILSAWKDSQGKLMLGGHDFNEQFGDGESFIKTRDWDGIIMPEWVEYAGEQFDGKDDGEPQMVKSKKRVAKKLVELDEDADGWLIFPDTTGWKRAEQQHMIWSFLTKLYRMCSGKENLKAAVPWGDVIHDPWAFFDGAHWPAGMQLKEPSKMNKADATTILDFWFDRQKNDMQPAFSFRGGGKSRPYHTYIPITPKNDNFPACGWVSHWGFNNRAGWGLTLETRKLIFHIRDNANKMLLAVVSTYMPKYTIPPSLSLGWLASHFPTEEALAKKVAEAQHHILDQYGFIAFNIKRDPTWRTHGALSTLKDMIVNAGLTECAYRGCIVDLKTADLSDMIMLIEDNISLHYQWFPADVGPFNPRGLNASTYDLGKETTKEQHYTIDLSNICAFY
ncbi:hypothetical protein EV424DRAFT_1544594 [Suillus variegatus]|nr:hypothetical protein EV424DRAFT_1544594 [Suillus variegatus]